jgi:hypothetical protein
MSFRVLLRRHRSAGQRRHGPVRAEEGTMRIRIAAMAALSTAVFAATAHAEIITIAYEANIVTVASKPFGLTIPLQTPVTGYFTYDTSTPDADPDDENFGEYPHTHNSAFVADFLETEIRGSHTAWYEMQPYQSTDTFRVYDGPGVFKHGGTMSIDGTPDDDIQLFLAITDDAFDTDELIDPFPFYTFGFLGTSHTFSLKDDQGTALLQLTKAARVQCGDPSGNKTTTAGDALQVLKTAVGTSQCLPCVCDADASGAIASTDALKVLRFAVAGTPPLDCAICL